ncbi:MAG: hypothetical protein Q8M03_11515 [Legionella sp.]|nr:hypothetical protein [Legionella sp.]
MNNSQIFSKFYSIDTTRNEDKPKFRNRVLKYLEDFTRRCFPHATYMHCRSEMGISLKFIKNPDHPRSVIYCIEDTFNKQDTPISDILDFITIVHDSVTSQPDSPLEKNTIAKFIDEINRIFHEESMCYVLQDNGRVRYYPDEEFHQAVKCSLLVLNKPKYTDNLKTFNNVLDGLYKNHSKESPIQEFFKCVETFTLTLINTTKPNRLNDESIKKLMVIVNSKINSDPCYATHNKEASANISNIFSNWVSMSHKYRHGKSGQTNNDVPSELFNQIFSTGISIFRWLLELDDKYQLIQSV